jgi:phosphoribosylaminoimidazole carboxylase PurE protein
MTQSKRSSKQNRKKEPILVGIVMGSISDAPILEETESVLTKFSITYKKTVASAHRTPDLVRKFIRDCEAKGTEVFIAAAGGAAALPGVVAAETIKPVIGVPIESVLMGLDSLLSIAQMPGGVPVAAMAVGKTGARNAGVLAVEILALSRPALSERLLNFRKDQRSKIQNDAEKLQSNA